MRRDFGTVPKSRSSLYGGWRRVATFLPSSQNSTALMPLPLTRVWMVCSPLTTPSSIGTMRSFARVDCTSS